MKQITAFLTLGILLIASVAMAAVSGQAIPFSHYSSPDTTTVYSSVYRVNNSRTKTVHVTGIATAGHTATTLDGTFLVQCGPSSNGPWSTCAQQDGTAVSFTANGYMSWDGAEAYIRASWAKTTKQVSAWLTWIDN